MVRLAAVHSGRRRHLLWRLVNHESGLCAPGNRASGGMDKVKYQIDKTDAGDQISFAGRPARPRDFLLSIGTIFDTRITGRYPENLKPKDFIEYERLRTNRRRWSPGDDAE